MDDVLRTGCESELAVVLRLKDQPSVREAVRLAIDDVQILQTVRSNRTEELRDFLETITPEQNEELQTDFSDTCVYDYIRKEMIV